MSSVAKDEAIAVLTVSIPESISTKAYSDGKKATDLYYAVYDGKNNEFLFGTEQPLKFPDGETEMNVEIKLVKNYPYHIVFWAQAPGAPYVFDQEGKTITVTSYSTAANDENRDAFYYLLKDYKIVPKTERVELTRPFAQINFGAKDYKNVTDLGLSMTSQVEIAGLPNILNVLDGTTSGSMNAAFLPTPVPAKLNEKLDVNGDKTIYSYVSMNYVLAPQNKATLDNVLGIFQYNRAEVQIPVKNVPYQRNYRTNIIGEFFTGPAQFEVVINPIYDKNSPFEETWPQK